MEKKAKEEITTAWHLVSMCKSNTHNRKMMDDIFVKVDVVHSKAKKITADGKVTNQLHQALISSFQWKKKSSKAMRRRRGDDWFASEIPLDLQIEILIRLPAKSLMRFKCVSKLWFSLIRSRCFSNCYLKVASPPRPPRLYMSLVDHIQCNSMEVCYNPRESVLLSLSSSSSTNAKSFHQDLAMPGMGGRNMMILRGLILYIVCRKACIYNPTTRQCCNSMEVCYNPCESVLLSLSSSSSTDAKSFHQDLTMPGMGGHNMMILRGLILYIVCRKACIYNPTTRQCVTLPAVKSNIFAQEDYRKSVLYFLGHDPVLDQYKVVCTVAVSSKRFKRITSEHWVFVLEPGGSWKRIEFDLPHCPARLGLCINGVIYFLASACMSSDILVSFDVMSEEFKWIQGPPVASAFKPMGFIEYLGKPSVFDHSHLKRKGSVDLWVLEDAGKWSKKSLVLQPCQMHLVDKKLSFTVKGSGHVRYRTGKRKLEIVKIAKSFRVETCLF
ncbi:predicted protein [Arabidopsis lyrata subsp. lyrata]|uniref:Predicted protein n=1 Tax=Arabidopsis lyrata subsp. lyrata TaxID=81972 RepID=D7MMD3_ARALL|nr:predicted protein [Arabidopsis lyrata subsp. lyrata]